MAFKIHVKEITTNPAFKEEDMVEMAYFIKQSLEIYMSFVNDGYLTTEDIFVDPESGSTIDIAPFQYENPEHLAYARSTLLYNLKTIYQFCFGETDKRQVLEHRISGGDGLNYFFAETIPPCLVYQSLVRNGILENYYHSDEIHRLLITFFAQLKLVYGTVGWCFIEGTFYHLEHLPSLGIDTENFSFRELTLLSGYQTERAVRNLASPSTPPHRRLSVIKQGRLTYVEHKEAVRWLASIGRYKSE